MLEIDHTSVRNYGRCDEIVFTKFVI